MALSACLERTLEQFPSPAAMVDHGSLGGGSAGLAVALAHLHQWQPNRGFRQAALAHLEVAFEALAKVPMGPGLFGGIAGIAWAHTQVMVTLGEQPEEAPCSMVDDLLEAYVLRDPECRLDLGEGLAGIGAYALARVRAGAGSRLLRATLTALGQRAALPGPDGPWPTLPGHLPPHHLVQAPMGYFNLGMAHGAPGITAFLGMAVRSCAGGPSVRRLLERSIVWLLAQRHPPGSPSTFGYWLPLGETPKQILARTLQPSRIAWCYGDLGAGMGLYLGALGASRDRMADAALAVCRQAAGRPMETSGVVDACFCHGSAGNAHLCHRLFQATGDPLFRGACLTWLERTLALEKAHGGFFTWWPEGDGKAGNWRFEPGLLYGVAGIALVLVACLTGTEPTWDRCLMTDPSGGV